jgi:hypothetical protein
MSGKGRKPRGLVAASQIKQWEREYSALGKQAQKLEQEREVIKRMIDAARSLSPRDGGDSPKVRRKRRGLVKRRTPAAPVFKSSTTVTPPPGVTPKRRAFRPERSEWKVIIREITLTSNHPVPYSEAREEILKSHLAEKLKQSDKGFYNAISKLRKAGEIVAHRGHLFSPAAFSKFKADLDAGLIRDIKIANVAHRSPMGEAVDQMMRSRPNGAESGHIIWELRKNPEFAAAIEKNKTHPYNVLSRMVRLGELIKKGKRYYSAHLKSEAPSANRSEGASKNPSEASPSLSDQPKGAGNTLAG